jgi:Rrf2 family protein
MEITRETDYAIRCVLYLARGKGKVIMIDEISRNMAIPKSFLAKILQKLTKGNIVTSFRGVRGGFQFNRRPEEVSLLDIIEIIEGPVAMNACALEEKACSFSSTCTVHPVWTELRKIVETYLRNADIGKLL